jgi:hypothetical protein
LPHVVWLEDDYLAQFETATVARQAGGCADPTSPNDSVATGSGIPA